MTDTAPVLKTEALELDPKKESPDNMSLETLILLIHTERLKTLRDQTADEFKELNDRQEEVSKLHDVQKAINQATTDKGSLEVKNNPELQELLTTAKELGVDIDLEKKKYSREERDRLIENLKMTIEDLNVKNDMQLQTVQRLTNERFESFQMARSIMKPMHDDKQNKARKMAGA